MVWASSWQKGMGRKEEETPWSLSIHNALFTTTTKKEKEKKGGDGYGDLRWWWVKRGGGGGTKETLKTPSIL